MKAGPRLLEFYGRECPHCIAMMPLVKQLEKETGVKVQQYEVWHDPNNARLLQQYDKGFCGGVPFFYNEDTHEWLCGSQDYETFKAWALKGRKK